MDGEAKARPMSLKTPKNRAANLTAKKSNLQDMPISPEIGSGRKQGQMFH